MEHDVQVVDSRDMLDAVLSRLEARQSSTAPVVHDGQLIGLLTADAVAEFLTIESHTIKNQWQLGRGRVEVMVLPQYLQLTALVGVA